MKQTKIDDLALGMDRSITRRDFLNGVAIAVAATLPASVTLAQSGATLAPAAQDAPGYYPPELTGLRGSHPGSFETAHGLREGAELPAPIDTGERYDLIVVGGG